MRQVMMPLLCLSLALGLGGCSKSKPPRAAAPVQPSAQPVAEPVRHGPEKPHKKRALLVGINDYEHDFNDLSGCVRDVDNMRDVLIKNFDFAPEAIVALRDHEATLFGITDQFEKHLVQPADQDTVTVFYFSGHGSQMRDLNGDEPDGWDETLVTYDSGRLPGHENRDLVDDRLNELLGRLGQKTGHVTVILDSCHSGTATRGSGTPRAAPRDERGQAVTARGTDDGASGMRDPGLRYALISGAGTSEYSYEQVIGGETNGALTWFLTGALRKARGSTTYRDVLDAVKSDVTAMFPAQHPQLEGTAQDDLVFGVKEVVPQPFVLVEKQNGRLQLAAGRAHGVTVDSVYGLYPPGEKLLVPGQEVMRAQVVELQDVTATLLPSRSSHPDLTTARAVELQHRHPAVSVRVFFRDADKSALIGGVRAQLLKSPMIIEARSARDYDLTVGPSATMGIVVEAGTPDPIAPEIPRSSSAIQEAERVVLAWARWWSIRALDNPSTQATQVSMDIGVSTPRGGLFEPGKLADQLHAGDQFHVTLKNDTEDRWFVYLLNVSGDGSVALLYPPAGANEQIEPHDAWTKTLRSCTPKGRKAPLRDVLKVFFTKKQTDFSFLAQRALARGESAKGPGANDPFSFLVQSAAGTRGAAVVSVEPGTWATRQRAIEITPQVGQGVCD